jgi:hypothetical protein
VDSTEFDDDEMSGDEGGAGSGSKLRQKLEEALSTNRKLAEEVSSFRAREVISSKGFKHVSAQDLAGVPLDQLEAKAAEIEQDKLAQREAVLREVLSEKGMPEQELEKAVKALVGDAPGDQTTSALGRMSQLAKSGGSVPPPVAQEGLFGPSRLRAALAAENP